MVKHLHSFPFIIFEKMRLWCFARREHYVLGYFLHKRYWSGSKQIKPVCANYNKLCHSVRMFSLVHSRFFKNDGILEIARPESLHSKLVI